MSRKSEHSQSPVRSAHGEIVKNEFLLCNLRRITSAREPLAVEQEHRKFSPTRRKLRKTHHSQQVTRFLSNISPNHLARDYASIEEKPPPTQHFENSLQISKYTSNVCDRRFDLGPTELIFSSPYEIPSSVFSSQSTTAPSCTSVPTSSAPTTSISSGITIKNPEILEKKEAEIGIPSKVKPSSAFQKCCKNGFQNVEDIIKLTPREQALLPRSLYLAAQLAATPNVNYSEKYGFRAFCDSKWLSPRAIASSLRAKSSFKQNFAIPDYLKEASHPLSDLRLIAKPWWFTIYKNRESMGYTSEVTKYELFGDYNRSLLDSLSETNTTDNTFQENYDYEYEKLIATYEESNTQTALFQELNSDSKETVQSFNRTLQSARNYTQVKSRGVQTYITFPYYTESLVDFWSESDESNINDSVTPSTERRRGSPYRVKTITCGINTHESDYQHVTNSNVIFEPLNCASYNIQNSPQMTKTHGLRHFNENILGNVNHQHNIVPVLRHIQNPSVSRDWQLRQFMAPGNYMNGTGDRAEKLSTQRYLIPINYVAGQCQKWFKTSA